MSKHENANYYKLFPCFHALSCKAVMPWSVKYLRDHAGSCFKNYLL